jgi:hypothetical protein
MSRSRTVKFYATDPKTLDLADEHGCLDEDVDTGESIVCATCAYPDATPPRDPSTGLLTL